MNIQQAIAAVIERVDLSTDEMTDVMRQIMTGETTPSQIGGFLIGLRMKGESVDEIAAAAGVMRELVTRVELDALVELGEPFDVALAEARPGVLDLAQILVQVRLDGRFQFIRQGQRPDQVVAGNTAGAGRHSPIEHKRAATERAVRHDQLASAEHIVDELEQVFAS